MKFAREAWPFVALALLASGGLALLIEHAWPVLVGLALAAFVLWFFRNPARSYDGPVDVVVAAADGVVTEVGTVFDPLVRDGESLRIVTFLSVFNVHVQRAPVEGEVVVATRRAGKKLAAYKPDIDLANESHLTVLRRQEGDLIGVRQIVGLIARRIVPWLRLTQVVERGELLGLIKFGSRVDLILPPTYEILVKKGDKLRCGETPVAMPTDPSTHPTA